MQKQIVYTKFIPRVFAMTLDVALLSLILTPIMNFISRYIFYYLFQDYFISQGITAISTVAMIAGSKSAEFGNYFSASKFFTYSISMFFLNTVFMGLYFITFWYKTGASPGKMIMRMQIVDAKTLSNPSLKQLIKRFLAYVTALIGIWSIIFNKKGLAMHDKIAGTVVIKK